MKYFSTENIWGKEKEDYIRLQCKGSDSDFDSNRVFSIRKSAGEIKFREECDQFFICTLSPEKAIEMLQEAIDWIKND